MTDASEKARPSERILATAFECLVTNGYANVTMRSIADEAGVALSQLTYYYKNKENLFLEVINRMTDQYLAQIEATLRARSTPGEKIEALADFFKNLITERPNLLGIFIDFTAQAVWIPSFRKQLDSFFATSIEIIERNLPETAMKTEARPEPVSKQIATLIFGAIFGTSIQTLISTDRENGFD